MLSVLRAFSATEEPPYSVGARLLVHWDTPGTATLSRSDRESGPWDVVYTGQADQFLDDPPGPESNYVRWYYLLTIEGSDVVYGPAVSAETPRRNSSHVARLAARHIARIGVRSHLFVESQERQRCTSCWDPDRRERTRSRCAVCDGSGFMPDEGETSGWGPSIPFYMSYSPQSPEPTPLQTTKIDALQVEAWTGSWPLLKIGDHIVREWDARVFEVSGCQPTRDGAQLIRQTCTLRAVERGSSSSSLATRIPHRTA